jgi:hypothetical protein
MPFASVSRFSLEALNQNYRAPGVLPRAVPPVPGDSAAAQDPTFKICDDFIRIVPFVRASGADRPVARQYQVRTAQDLFEPPFTAQAGAGTVWAPGATTAFGQELEITGSRVKKISTLVRDDELMERSMMAAQVRLAEIATVRTASQSFWNSLPANDDMAEWAGIRYYNPANSPQNVTYDATRKLIGGLDEIVTRCCPSDGDFGAGPDAIFCTPRVVWRLAKEYRDLGLNPPFRYCPLTGKQQIYHNGVPVLTARIGEPTGANSTTEAYALNFGPSGVRIVHVGGDSNGYALRRQATTVNIVDASGEVKGTTPGIEVFMIAAVLVGEQEALACLNGIPTEDPYTHP